MLAWLLDVETTGDRLSVTPVGGWARGELRPGYDQQPIEVAALADACARALDLTGDPHWAAGLERCRAWFLGANDTGVMLLDVISGGGCDGLMQHGRQREPGGGVDDRADLDPAAQRRGDGRRVVSADLVVRSPLVLRPDPGRVIARQFLPGQEVLADGRARVDAVVDRVQAMADEDVTATLAATVATFGHRHDDLDAVFARHFAAVAAPRRNRRRVGRARSPAGRLLHPGVRAGGGGAVQPVDDGAPRPERAGAR